MRAPCPHVILFSDATDAADGPRWRFILKPAGESGCLAVADSEPDTHGSRLELLAVVRGLEAIDQPSRVTLLTGSRYVSHGLRRGLRQWRSRRWRWERFGRLVPIRDHDLWQRVDRALCFHQVECCRWPLGQTDCSAAPEAAAEPFCASRDSAVESRPTAPIRQRRGRLVATMSRVWRGVLALPGAFWRPAFTRTA